MFAFAFVALIGFANGVFAQNGNDKGFAHGNGQFVEPGTENKSNFSVTAQAQSDGTAKGNLIVNQQRDQEIQKLQVRVSCVSFRPNNVALVAGVILKASPETTLVNGQPFNLVGSTGLITLYDGGKGKDEDQASFVLVSARSPQEICQDPTIDPPAMYRTSNVTVRPNN